MLRRTLFALLLAAAALPLAAAQDPPAVVKPAPKLAAEGIWEGPLKAGPVELRLAFHVKNADGKLTATMDSIDQGAKGIPCDAVSFEDKKLALDLPKLKAKFAGEMALDAQSVKGEWSQAGQKFPLTLKRVERASTLNRPQTPKRPFPYRAEDVTVDNPAAAVRLAGTLTLPQGDVPFPAAVLVSGSGPQDRDETLFGHKPFLVLADHLTRNGVAVLRYDDRGVGKSTGQQEGATSADFAADAHAAVTYLKGRKEVDGKRVGIIGHSEGGLIAPMVAADHPADVGFVVLLAGTGLPGDQVLKGQLAAILKGMGEPADKVAVAVRLQQAILTAAVAEGPADGLKDRLKAAAEKAYDVLSETDKKLAGSKQEAGVVDEALGRLADPWMVYFLRFDPRQTLARVRCPVLAVNGGLDLQVLPKDNLPEIEKAVRAGGNDKVTVKEFPGLNHLFQPAKTGAVAEYGQIEQTLAPEVLEIVTVWVRRVK